MSIRTIGITVTASGLLLPALTGLRYRVHGVVFGALQSTIVRLQSDATDISGQFPVSATGGFVLPFCPGGPGWMDTAVGEALNIAMTVNTTVGIQLVYEPF